MTNTSFEHSTVPARSANAAALPWRPLPLSDTSAAAAVRGLWFPLALLVVAGAVVLTGTAFPDFFVGGFGRLGSGEP